MRSFWNPVSVKSVAARIGGKVSGFPDAEVSGVSMLDDAEEGDLVYIGSEKYFPAWESSPATMALVSARLAERVPRRAGDSLIVVANVDIALAAVLEMFSLPPVQAGMPPEAGENAASVHPSAMVHTTACLGAGAVVGAYCVVGPGARVGANTVLHAGVMVLDDAVIGASCVLRSGVVFGERCLMGDRCILHANVVIGADGFGYRPGPGGRVVRIPHVGDVVIGDEVEIGANSCVDRGKLASTVIGDFCKIDNLCQIGHNSTLGKGVLIAGQTGISGSVTIGDGVLVGGGVGIADHITVGAGAQIAASSGVMRDVPEKTRVGGTPARQMQQLFRELAAVTRLPEFMKRHRNVGEPAGPDPSGVRG